MGRWIHASTGGRGTSAGKRASTDGEASVLREDFGEGEGGQLSVSSFYRAVAATDRHDLTAPRPCSARTRATVERFYRDGWRNTIIGQVAAQHPDEALDLIADLFDRSVERALQGLCPVDRPTQVHRWIERDMNFALGNELERRRAARRSGRKLVNGLPRPGELPGPETEVSQRENAELAAQLLSEAKLTPRDRNIVQLVWGQRLKRASVAGTLGVSERVVKRTIEKAGPRLESTLVKSCGGGCGSAQESLVRRHAFNHPTVSEVEREQALAHLQACPDCARLFSRLDEIRLGVAALTPVPVAAPGVGERVADRFGGLIDSTRDQATSAYHRAYELSASPPPFRPGAAMASVGACVVAAGGGYCIQQAIPPIPALKEPVDAAEPKDQPANAPEEENPAAAPPVESPAPPQLPTEPAPPTPPPAPQAATPEAPPAPPPSQEAPAPAAPQEDFGIERSQPSEPAQPSPAPSGGGGEFL